MPHTTPSNTIHSSNQISTHSNHNPNETLGISNVSCLACSSYSNSKFWFLDLGANDHLCSSLHFFHSYYQIKPISVFLPNENFVYAKYAAIVIFSPHLHITNVIFIQFNLSFKTMSIP